MKFLNNLTLGKKITLLTALGLLFGVGVFSFIGMHAVNQATETMLQERLTTASIVADHLDEALGRALNELKSTARGIESADTKTLDTHVEALRNIYARLSINAHDVYLVDREGRIVWSSPDTTGTVGINISSYPAVNEAIEKGQPGISGLVSAPLTSSPVILLISPTGGAGVLVVAVDPAQSGLAGFVKPIRMGQTGYVEIVDQDGTVVTRTEPGPELAAFEKSDHSGRFAALISAGKPTRGVCHTCHEFETRVETRVERKDVLAFTPLSEARWGVVLRQSEDEALAPTRELYRSLFIFGLVLVTVALLFVAITTRDIGGRIRMLSAASQRMAEGDLVSPVTASGRDEVGVLASTLDGMRTKLKTSYSELEQKTKELSSLLSVSQILTSTLDLSRLLDAVVAKAVEVIPGADGGALLLESADGRGPLVQCAIGLDKESLARLIPSPAAETAQGPVPEERKDTVEDAVNALLRSDVLQSRVKGSIRAEVYHNNRHVGSLIMISSRDARAFTESDRRLLEAIADYIAIAIERAHLAREAAEVRALQEVDRLRSQLISSVSHELRTPLTLIKGYSTSLLRQDVTWDKQTQQEFLKIIDEKTDELRELIDKLLQSAKLEAGALKLSREPVLMPRLVQKVVEDLAPRAKKQKFTVKFAASFPVVEADVRCMEQAVRNLVENAVKYSPEGSEITIAGEAVDDQVVVTVTDEGVGIPPEHRDKIFERFYRIDSPRTRGIPGSGLGLFITRGHVEAHGGKVWLESTAGKGSKFHFSLPLEHKQKAADDE